MSYNNTMICQYLGMQFMTPLKKCSQGRELN